MLAKIKCIYNVGKNVFSWFQHRQGHNNILGKTSPAFASIFRSTIASALVGPMFTTAIGIPKSLAWVTNLWWENLSKPAPWKCDVQPVSWEDIEATTDHQQGIRLLHLFPHKLHSWFWHVVPKENHIRFENAGITLGAVGDPAKYRHPPKQWNCSKRTICTSTMAHLSTWTYQQSPQLSPHLHQVLVRPKASHLSRPWPTCIIIQKSPDYFITWSLPPPLAKVLHHHLASSSVHWPRSPLWD